MGQPATKDTIIGSTIGNYQVIEKIGEGGMGSVYLAEHPLIGKKVACKVLHGEYLSNEDVVHRFFTEAKAVTEIHHPNIVEVLDYGVIEIAGQKTVYFIMEFLAGISLGQLIKQHSKLPVDQALQITMQCADALQACHEKGIVHRDLKPDNIMLINRGRERNVVKILDFGIAKLTSNPDTKRTRAGLIMGTPAYMSPEQCEGLGKIDARTDIYSLGILLYQMLTGRVPFTGEAYSDVLVQHLTRPPQSPVVYEKSIPKHVEAIILKSLRKRPEDRLPSMMEFAKAAVDPVAYVDRNGGLSAFHGTPLTVTPLPLPDVSSGSHNIYSSGEGYPTIADGNGKKSNWPLIAGLIGAIVIGLAIVVGLGQSSGSEDSSTSSTTSSTASQRSPTPSSSAAAVISSSSSSSKETIGKFVTVTFDSTPSGARIMIDGEKRGTTPTDLKLPLGQEPITVALRKTNYVEDRFELVPNKRLLFDRELTKKRRRPPSSSKKTSSSKRSSSSKSDGFVGWGD